MKIKNEHVDKRHQISINGRRDKGGKPTEGIVISQARGYILISLDEWEELKRAGDQLVKTQKTG